MTRSQAASPILEKFLDLLYLDLEEHPGRVEAFPESLLRRARAVAGGIAIGHGAPLDGAVEF